jgi:WD40 repeat protein
MHGSVGKLIVSLVVVLMLTIACVSLEGGRTPSVHTVSGKVSGSWSCFGPASPAPMTVTLLPIEMQAYFTRSSPEFSFESVPDGDYTLVACCDYWGMGDCDSGGGMPITVAGADVYVDVVLPYPTLPRYSSVDTLTDHTEIVLDLVFSLDGAELISIADDGTLIRWDLVTGERQTREHGRLYREAVLSPGGETLAVSTVARGTLELWDTETGERLHTLTFRGDLRPHLAFSPDGTTLAVMEEREGVLQIALWNATTGERLHTLIVDQGRRPSRTVLDFSPDGTTLVSVVENENRRNDKYVVWWDVATENHLRSVSFSDIGEVHYDVWEMAVSPNGTNFAFGLSGIDGVGGLVIWDTSTGHSVSSYYPTDACDLAFSPDGTLITSATYDNTIILWDTITGEARYVFTSGVSGLCKMAWSPDGKMLAAGAGNGTIVLWEAP